MSHRVRPWSDWEAALMRELYPHVETAVVAWLLDRKIYSVHAMAATMGVKKTREMVADTARERSAHPDHPMRLHQFPKGHEPINKGRKGYCAPGSKATWFAKGHQRNHTAKVGAERINKDGYVMIKVAARGNYASLWRLKQREVWQAAHGAIPAGLVVAFRDGNKSNCALDNLYLLSRRDNMARNTVHNLPKPLASTIQLLGALKRSINGKQRRKQHDHGSADPLVRNAQGAQRQE